YLLIIHQAGSLLDHVRLVDQIRDLTDNDALPVVTINFYFGFSSHYDPAAPGLKCFLNPRITIDYSSGWKIRSFNMLHQFGNGYFIIFDISNYSIDYFREVMWWHIGSHPHGNT